jgi:hypothetical protein
MIASGLAAIVFVFEAEALRCRSWDKQVDKDDGIDSSQG